MIDFSNIHLYSIPPPQNGTVFGSPAQFDALPGTHKEQILFLNKKAEKFLYEFVDNAQLISDGGWAPFSKGIFKTVEQYEHAVDLQENIPLLKKWLYTKGIPFSTRVFVLSDSNSEPLLMTWKMLIKYAFDLFIIGDTMVFDPSCNWCVFNYHEGQLFFARDNIYDSSGMEHYMQELNERKKKYPQFKHPYL